VTPAQLRSLLAEADAGPWWFDGRDIFHKKPDTNLDQIIIPIPSAEETFHPSQAVTPATARLASLAPELALSLADALEALGEVLARVRTRSTGIHMDGTTEYAQPILAEIDALCRSALEGPADGAH